MKNTISFIIFISFFNLNAQLNDLNNLIVQDINFENQSIAKYIQDKYVIISFWATWCSNCIEELDEINDEFADWQKQKKISFIAVSIDDYRTIARVTPFIKSRQWPFTILLDTNQNLKRVFNFESIPYTLVFNNGKIVYQKSGYAPNNISEIKYNLKLKSP
ncbi:MAG: TlpA family protein disulfide reductase [Lutibacter sp.]